MSFWSRFFKPRHEPDECRFPPSTCLACGVTRYGLWRICERCGADYCSHACYAAHHGCASWWCFKPELKSDGQPECMKEKP